MAQTSFNPAERRAFFPHGILNPRTARDTGAAPFDTHPASDSASAIYQFAALAGRLLLAHIFLLSGFMKFMDWSGTAAHMQQAGLPFVNVLLPIAALTEIIGALMILVGYQARLGALLLFLFLIPTTLTFHAFWTFDNPQERQMQMINFMKNLTIMGGLLMVFSFGAGGWSVDERRRA